jgi:hypothetical protein
MQSLCMIRHVDDCDLDVCQCDGGFWVCNICAVRPRLHAVLWCWVLHRRPVLLGTAPSFCGGGSSFCGGGSSFCGGGSLPMLPPLMLPPRHCCHDDAASAMMLPPRHCRHDAASAAATKMHPR